MGHTRGRRSSGFHPGHFPELNCVSWMKQGDQDSEFNSCACWRCLFAAPRQRLNLRSCRLLCRAKELQNGNLDDFWDQYLTALHWHLGTSCKLSQRPFITLTVGPQWVLGRSHGCFQKMSSVLECSPLFSFVGVRNGGAPFHDSNQELTARVPGLLTIWEDHFSGKETVWSFFLTNPLRK